MLTGKEIQDAGLNVVPPSPEIVTVHPLSLSSKLKHRVRGSSVMATLINFKKFALLAEKIKELLEWQSAAYCLVEVELIQTWLNKVCLLILSTIIIHRHPCRF